MSDQLDDASQHVIAACAILEKLREQVTRHVDMRRLDAAMEGCDIALARIGASRPLLSTER